MDSVSGTGCEDVSVEFDTHLATGKCWMVARICTFCASILLIEANDVLDTLHRCIVKLGQILVHEIVAFNLVNRELRYGFLPVLPKVILDH